MVVSRILLVRGIILKREELLKIIGIEYDTDDYHDFKGQYVYGEDEHYEFDGFHVHGWPCCSKLTDERFIVGYLLTSESLEDIFNKEITIGSNAYYINHHDTLDDDLEIWYQKYDFDEDAIIQNIVLCNDCLYCS